VPKVRWGLEVTTPEKLVEHDGVKRYETERRETGIRSGYEYA
jgi:hypothetical protein